MQISYSYMSYSISELNFISISLQLLIETTPQPLEQDFVEKLFVVFEKIK
jgi:hypothetical protein